MDPTIAEARPQIQTILKRIQLSLQLCIPIYIFTVIFAGVATGLFFPTLGVVVTTAFGATLIITTQRDHIRNLEAAIDDTLNPPALCNVKAITWCLGCVAVWGLEVGLIVVSLVIMVANGPIWPSVMVLGILHSLFAAGQAGLLFSVAMLCIEERKYFTGIRLEDDIEGLPSSS
ncbi:hypothetical protein BKA70DRAFT_1285497, partial [Coprinopsis sp. MPI-PUGE-AT-0042]